jgi:hypothetical protein
MHGACIKRTTSRTDKHLSMLVEREGAKTPAKWYARVPTAANGISTFHNMHPFIERQERMKITEAQFAHAVDVFYTHKGAGKLRAALRALGIVVVPN